MLPEPSIRQFVDRLIPTEAEKLLLAAREAIAAGKTAEAELHLLAALALDPDLHSARVELAEQLCGREAFEDATKVYDAIPERARDSRSERVATLLEQWRMGHDLPNAKVLVEACLADPANLDLKLQLGERYAVEGQHAEALAALLEVVRRDRGAKRESARRAMLRIFALSGDFELVGHFRRELASALH